MNDSELKQNLQRHYQNLYGSPPPAEMMCRRIVPHLSVQDQKISWRQFLAGKQRINGRVIPAQRHLSYKPIQHVAIVLAALVVGFMIIATTTYAATGSGPLSDLFSILGVKPIVQQFSDYHQSKSVDGYTITIQKVYADANRVLIGYISETPAGGDLSAKFALGESSLTTEQGAKLRPIEGVSGIESISGNLFAFDASSIQGTPEELHLHLAIPYGSQPQSAAFHIDGYLAFDFAVPFHPGKLVDIHQSVTAKGSPVTERFIDLENGQKVERQVVTLNGQTVTLEQIVISPSETRAYIKGFNRTSPSFIGSMLSYQMRVDGQTYKAGMFYEGSDVWQVNFDDPSLVGKKGVWILTVQQEISQVNPKTGKYGPEPVPGATWTFQFTVQ